MLYLRQGVTLTGLGCEAFETAVMGIVQVHDLIGSTMGEGMLEQWQPGDYLTHLAVNLSNRYFTPIRDCPCLQPIPLGDTVDPRGIMKQLAGPDLVHTQENKVNYYRHIADATGIKG